LETHNGAGHDLYIRVKARAIITIVLFVLGYVFLGVWWASGTNTLLRAVADTQKEIKVDIQEIRQEGVDDRFRGEDADVMEQRLQHQIDNLEVRLLQVEKK